MTIFDPKHTFVTSDHHFGSWRGNPCPWRPPVFSQAEEETLIAKWNSVVNPGDTVLYVGDFCDGDVVALMEYRQRLSGSIVLIKGNHDELPDEVYGAVFQGVFDQLVIDDCKLVVKHCPDEELEIGFRQIHGHLHNGASLRPLDPTIYFSSCVMQHDGYPVSLMKTLNSHAVENKHHEH